MKRIISLLLVLVLAAGMLVSCGYSIAKDDMSNYSTFDKAAFVEALKKLEIADGDFTTVEATRNNKTDDAIFTSSAITGLAEKKETGKLGQYDTLYYCYFVTFTKDEKEIVVFADNMKESSAAKLQVNLKAEEADSLSAKIYEALKDYEFLGKTTTGEGDDAVTTYGTNYNTSTATDKAAARDKICITYTEEYTLTGATTSTKTTYTNVIVTLDEADAFLAQFKDKEAGKAVTITKVDDATTVDGRNYTDVKLNWIINSGTEFQVKDTTYEDSKEATDTAGIKHDLKGIELTYHIYPVYYMDAISELTWQIVMETAIGTSISSTYLDCFGDEANKAEGGKTLKELIDGNEELTALSTLIYNKNNATEDTDKKDEEAGKKTAKILLEERMALIKAVVDAKSLGDTIISEYKQYIFDNLETRYNNEIKTNLATEIEALITKSVVMKEGQLPEKLVDDVYYILMQNHKYTFYTGSSKVDGSDVSYYAQKDGSFEKYLISVFTVDGEGPKTMKEAEAKVMDDAKTFVTYLVKLQAVSEAFECVITDKEYKEMSLDDPYYNSYVLSYGDIGMRAAYQFTKLYDKLLLVEGEQEAIDEYNAKVEAGDTEAEYDFEIVYDADGKIPFVNIKYTLKTDD